MESCDGDECEVTVEWEIGVQIDTQVVHLGKRGKSRCCQKVHKVQSIFFLNKSGCHWYSERV